MLESGTYTNIGDCALNEDCAAVYNGRALSAYVLADGLGGHGGGDIASKLVTEIIGGIINQAGQLSQELLSKCFESAQSALLEEQHRVHREGAMKTTLVVLLTDGQQVMWGHIGDSRLYHCRKGKVISRTLDHSVPQMLVRLRKIKDKDIRHHEERNVLLKVMGIPWGDSQMYEIDCTGQKIRSGDTFVLCSDGFWEWLEDERIAKLACQSKDVGDIAVEMGDEAYAAGLGSDRDNITMLITRKQ